MARKPAAGPTAIPSRDDILAYIRERKDRVTVSDLARHFGVKGKDRARLRAMLRAASAEGALDSAGRRSFAAPDHMPKVTVLEITGTDPDGELLARPVTWPEGKAVPVIWVAPLRGQPHALATGERILAKLEPDEDGGFDATVMRRLGAAPTEIIGVYARERGRGIIRATDRRAKYDYGVEARFDKGAQPGDLVRARVLAERSGSLRMVQVVECVGRLDSPGAIGLIALHSNDIPIPFPHAALEEAEAARPPGLEAREDLRRVPLVTIDDEDARDFDDAVFAEPDDAADNKGGHRLIVAIADVAWFVRPGGALDRAAERRGNSVYLPDRVVPMLPEALSNGLCSLRPHEDRAVLACHMRIAADGRILDHRFSRALMHSAARLTYRIAQRYRNGDADALPDDLPPAVVDNLYAAFASLETARRARGTLELELPEYKVTISDGKVTDVGLRTRLDSHRLIEEFMIAANVAAAEALEAKRTPCMYRVHPPPDGAKLEALRDFLSTFGLSLPRGQVTRAAQFADILARAAGTPSADVIHEAVLRSQSQAMYSPSNAGHFGLALRRYAHFTSPIRRYADLMVHRGLIAAWGLGAGGVGRDGDVDFDATALHISATERKAQSAERDAMDRYMALYLSERTGARMKGRITGVTRFGLFVRLKGLGADGLVPMGLLGDERFHHDERRHCIEGQRTGRTFFLGDDVEVEIREATPLTGGLVLAIIRHLPLKREPLERAESAPRKGHPRNDRPGPGRAPGRRPGRGKRKKTRAKP